MHIQLGEETLSLQETSKRNKGSSILRLLYVWLFLFDKSTVRSLSFPCLKENNFSLCLVDDVAWNRIGKKGSVYPVPLRLYSDFGVKHVSAMVCEK